MSDEINIDRRVVRVPVYREWVEQLFRGDLAIVERLPDDIRFTGAYHDPLRDTYYFKFKSEQFEPVPEDDVIPEHEPEVQWLNGQSEGEGGEHIGAGDLVEFDD